MLYRSSEYSQWDGTQRIFELDADQLMDLLSEDIIKDGDVMQALRDLLRKGLQDRDGQQMPGLRELMEQLKNQRREQLQQHNMDSVVDDLKERLDEIVQTEREGIKRRMDEASEQVEAHAESNKGEDKEQQEGLLDLLKKRAEHNQEKLDALPEGLAGQIKDLMEYDFMDPDAQQKFQELLDTLKSQISQNMGQQMMDQVKSMSEEDQAATRDMMRALNEMLRDKMAGQEPDFDGFMQEFGQMFGDNPPKSFDELLEQLQQQLAHMQSMLDSMSPEARREMEDALAQALDPATQREMAEFASLMEQMMPMDDLRRQYPFLG
ncbi:MAG: VWA domain-containing protein, partial [Dehalococcoidia bacterium]|nr:VWA domain-containing protein [Dehalococcoidia bacterium]